MSGASSIEWTDATWNPVRGCSRVSEGCRNCYAERQAARFSGQGLDGSTPPAEHFTDGGAKYLAANPFWGFAERTKAGPRWTGKVELVPHMLDWPLRKRKPLRIFVNSMSDLFHEKLSDVEIAAVFGVMAAAPQHTFQVLTKRPERMKDWFTWLESKRGPLTVQLVAQGGVWPDSTAYSAESVWCTYCAQEKHGVKLQESPWAAWPLPNVWLGTSVEDQATADERIPHLLATPAAKRFVSYEPALGPVDFGQYGWLSGCDACCNGDRCPGPPECTRFNRRSCPVCKGSARGNNLDWIIVGGESGPGARPFDVTWARSTIQQCKAAGVAVFVKQLGARPFNSGGPIDAGFLSIAAAATALRINDRKGGDWSEWPEDLRVREFPR